MLVLRYPSPDPTLYIVTIDVLLIDQNRSYSPNARRLATRNPWTRIAARKTP